MLCEQHREMELLMINGVTVTTIIIVCTYGIFATYQTLFSALPSLICPHLAVGLISSTRMRKVGYQRGTFVACWGLHCEDTTELDPNLTDKSQTWDLNPGILILQSDSEPVIWYVLIKCSYLIFFEFNGWEGIPEVELKEFLNFWQIFK